MTVKCDYMGAVIGWKHNHQTGMATADGEITEFPGGVPSDSDINAWKTEYDAWKTIIDEINRLEAQVTNRRLREAHADPTWLNAQVAVIAAERAKL